MPYPNTASVPSFGLPIHLNQQQTERQRIVAAQAQQLATTIADQIPECPERVASFEALRVAVMWSNQAVISSTQTQGAGG